MKRIIYLKVRYGQRLNLSKENNAELQESDADVDVDDTLCDSNIGCQCKCGNMV